MIELLIINYYLFMGFGKKWKRFAGSIGKAVGDLTGSEFVGRAAAGGSSGYSMIERQQTQAKNAMAQNEQNQAVQQAQQAQIAEQSRLRLLAEQDLQTQLEQEKKRTTFAGAIMQGISERKRLLGV